MLTESISTEGLYTYQMSRPNNKPKDLYIQELSNDVKTDIPDFTGLSADENTFSFHFTRQLDSSEQDLLEDKGNTFVPKKPSKPDRDKVKDFNGNPNKYNSVAKLKEVVLAIVKELGLDKDI